MTSVVGDARPPRLFVAVLNPMLKLLLRSPLGRSIRPLALLDFTGRRSGRRFSVVVCWHTIDGLPVVITPASWRANFSGGRRATVRSRAERTELIGTLDEGQACDDLGRGVEFERAPPGAGAGHRRCGHQAEIALPEGHTITADDVRSSGRTIVRFAPVTSSPLPSPHP